jgi:site-specific DNA-methyltransferase (adenine-specific)
METNALYYGDNLVWLKKQDCFPDESVDLIYLDPPFNSHTDYQALFKSENNKELRSKLVFDGTWRWDQGTSDSALRELSTASPDIAQLIALIASRGDKISTSMSAYLEMVTIRLLELRRVLKPTGSIYLHCNATASHYLKIIMDSIFGSDNYMNEIIWKSTHSTKVNTSEENKRFTPNTDTILFYRQSPSYFYKDFTSHSLWDDIKPLSSRSREQLGFPTQKPLPLLTRIIEASSKEGDVVLDPFCGCGTAVIAAHKLKRKWMGIDSARMAVYMVEQRLKDSFGDSIKKSYHVYGNPCNMASAQALWNGDKKEFEIWALSLIGAKPRPYDGEADGMIEFMEAGNKPKKIVVQVKGNARLVPGMIQELVSAVEKEKAAMGLLISLNKPSLGMITDSVHAGSYNSELWNKEFLRIQIRTVFELLEGKTFDIPPTYSLLKKAARVKELGETTPLI